MATSGVTTISTTANDLLSSAYELARVKDPVEAMNSQQTTRGISQLNKLIKFLQKNGLQLWARKTDKINLIQGQGTDDLPYTLGPSGNALNERPLRIIEAWYRDGDSDIPVQPVSAERYWALGDKTIQGIPNQLYYDPQVTLGKLYIYNVADANAAGNDLYLVYQRPFEIISDLEDTFDFPEEWHLALEYLLAVDLALRNGIKQTRISQLKYEAQQYFNEVTWWDVENTSTQIIPCE